MANSLSEKVAIVTGGGGRDGVGGPHVGRDPYGYPGQPKKTSASA